ncbi:hypothetical protein GCM10009687_03020 [Asanoa iriomotensis]
MWVKPVHSLQQPQPGHLLQVVHRLTAASVAPREAAREGHRRADELFSRRAPRIISRSLGIRHGDGVERRQIQFTGSGHTAVKGHRAASSFALTAALVGRGESAPGMWNVRSDARVLSTPETAAQQPSPKRDHTSVRASRAMKSEAISCFEASITSPDARLCQPG